LFFLDDVHGSEDSNIKLGEMKMVVDAKIHQSLTWLLCGFDVGELSRHL
jgi:hypothetical protein